jgi:MoaA/NifB/PqqE/SkfB family radical SAM enzyme
VLTISDIESLHIELTTRCNARCPMCMRNYRGSDYNSGYPTTELSLADIKKILPPEFIKNKQVLINGNLGDFGLAKDALEIVGYFVENNALTRIHTNGSMRTPGWWAQLAHPKVQIGFALDGLADTHSLYRLNTDWNSIIKNAQAFIAAGGNASWRFIAFGHNLHQETECRQMAKDLGFVSFDYINQGRDNGPVYTRAGDFTHWLGEPWHDHVPDIKPMVQSHITWYDSKTFKSSKDTTPLNISCQHKVRKELYIAANGEIYPCCYLGYYPQTMHHPGNEQLKILVKRNNALEYPIEECIKWFDTVEETWNKSSIAEGRLYACVTSCSANS